MEIFGVIIVLVILIILSKGASSSSDHGRHTTRYRNRPPGTSSQNKNRVKKYRVNKYGEIFEEN